MRRPPLVRHLPVTKLRYKYRSCRHPVGTPRWHAPGLLARADVPRTPAADPAGRSAVTVRHVLHRWSDHGPEGAADRRKGNGAEPKLTARRRAAVHAALRRRPPDGGVWTGPTVARYVKDRWRVGVCPGTGWRWRVALGFPPGAPPGPPAGGRRSDPPAGEKTCGGG